MKHPPAEWRRALALCGVIALMISAFYLSIYAVHGLQQPIGYDTAEYVWRTDCVAEGGLQHLDVCVPPGGRSLPSRVGYPLVALPIAQLLSISRLTFAAVLPAAVAASIGLGAAALATSGTRDDVAVFAIVAAVVGASPMVVQLTAYHADTMLAVVLVLGALVVTLGLVVEGRGYVAAASLFAAAAIVHWPTAAVLGATLAVAVLPWVRGDWRKVRAGEPLRSTVFVRIGTVLCGAALFWGSAFVVLVRASPDSFPIRPAGFEGKFRSRLPAYGLPLSAPAAAVGALGMLRGAGGRSRVPTLFLVGLFASWLGLTALGVAAWFLGVERIPPHRLLVLALPLPILGAFGLMWAAGWLRRHSRRLAGAAMAIGVAAVFAVGYYIWLQIGVPTLRTEWLGDAHTAAEYLDRAVPEDQDVVIVVPGSRIDALTENLRVALPPARIGSVRVHVGPSSGVTGRAPPGQEPVLLLRSFSPSFDRLAAIMPNRLAAPNVLVLRGPLPTEAVDPVRPPRIEVGYPALILLALATIVLLGLIGYGWTVASLGTSLRPFERLAVTPAFGLGAIVLAGLIIDKLGLSLTGPGGALVLLSAGGGGVVAALIVRVRGSGRGRNALAPKAPPG